MTKVLMFIGVLLVVGGLAFHFAALEIFGFLVPKDHGSRLLARDVAYGDHARQRLDVYAPIEGTGPFPVVVFVHGGSWGTGNKNPYAFAGRALAAQGFLAMVINYRLHPDVQYPVFVQDTALALRWAVAHATDYDGDARKVFAMGHSAGGYNVAQAVLAEKVDVAGVITAAAPLDFLPLDSPITIKVFGGLQDLPVTQPVNHIHMHAPPFLILHGSADDLVRVRNSTSLDQKLRAAGIVSILKIYEGASHRDLVLSLSTWSRSSAPVLGDVTQFIKDTSQ
jgi:acetyl esterase/lipase